MDLNAIIEPLRTAVAAAAEVDYLSEGGNDAALPDRGGSRFATMRIESLPVSVMGHDYAVLDRMMDFSAVFVLALRVDATGRTEAMSELRDALNAMAAVALDSADWGASLPCGLIVQGGEYGMGDADDYGQYFQAHGGQWVAGHFTLTMQVVY